jgi:methylated-DNA-protein-cysteine methyltransferase-like protein
MRRQVSDVRICYDSGMALFAEQPKPKKPKGPQTFGERVVALALSIPPGKVSTYGAIAMAAGGPRGRIAQSVAGILGKAYNADEKGIPFHRIVYSGGRIWISDEYRKKRLALYKKEGIQIDKKDHIVDFADKLFEFKTAKRI